jgi:hypothetical protein
MTDRTIFTRVYSNSSAGQLTSGRRPTEAQFSEYLLLDEFRRHANRSNRTPTALVSVSNRIIDTVQRAFQKHQQDGESPEDIWIVFLEVPANEEQRAAPSIHYARDLAEQLQVECPHLKPNLYKYEFLFEWGIPEDYVLHRVSLQTLMERGLQIQASSTRDLRSSTAGQLQGHGGDGFGIGVELASFAKKFGARAPVEWIAYQWFYDCVGVWFDPAYPTPVKLHYADGYSETVEIEFLFKRDEGIETALQDWWLTDFEFVVEYNEFVDWRDAMEGGMACEEFELWETCHGNEAPEQVPEEEERILWDKLSVDHSKIWKEIEAEAIRIGL